MNSGGTPYCVYKYRTALIGAATSATVTGSRTKSLCSIQETSRAPNQEAAILASKSHIMPPFLLSRTTSAQSASLRDREAGSGRNHITFTIIHTGKIHAQYPISPSSNFKSHVVASEMEAQSNLDITS